MGPEVRVLSPRPIKAAKIRFAGLQTLFCFVGIYQLKNTGRIISCLKIRYYYI